MYYSLFNVYDLYLLLDQTGKYGLSFKDQIFTETHSTSLQLQFSFTRYKTLPNIASFVL